MVLRKVKFKKMYLAILCVIVGLFLSACSEKKVSSTEFAMNTVVTITAYGDKAGEAVDDAINEVRRVEKLLSCHIENSEISMINKNAHLSPVKVSEETILVLKKALEMSEKTGGAFDISIKPLCDLWNIGSENPKVPTDEEIFSVKKLVGYENIVIDGSSVFFRKEGVQIDLGGAAKGYCADKIVEILKKHGIKNAILDLGGNIYALGKNEQGKKWRIGLQDPSADRGKHFEVVELNDLSAVTSGSYERYFEKDGKVYHHIIDPKTGKSADSNLISVSVIAKNSFEADMLSTAIFVMGQEGFGKISENFSFEKYITVDKNNVARTYSKQ